MLSKWHVKRAILTRSYKYTPIVGNLTLFCKQLHAGAEEDKNAGRIRERDVFNAADHMIVM